jgi:hypothetical protein
MASIKKSRQSRQSPYNRPRGSETKSKIYKTENDDRYYIMDKPLFITKQKRPSHYYINQNAPNEEKQIIRIKFEGQRNTSNKHKLKQFNEI